MSRYTERDAAAVVAQLRVFSWRVFSWRTLYRDAWAWLRSCRQRQRERRQLLDYMAIDHRAAADIGVQRHDALEWANRPFWRD